MTTYLRDTFLFKILSTTFIKNEAGTVPFVIFFLAVVLENINKVDTDFR